VGTTSGGCDPVENAYSLTATSICPDAGHDLDSNARAATARLSKSVGIARYLSSIYIFQATPNVRDETGDMDGSTVQKKLVHRARPDRHRRRPSNKFQDCYPENATAMVAQVSPTVMTVVTSSESGAGQASVGRLIV
jgi:hypothetical protein